MNESFNPLKCVAWWIYGICLIIFIVAFILGRLLGAQPVVVIEAWSQGKKVAAAVTIAGKDEGKTPAEGESFSREVRAPRGKTLELSVAFGGATKSVTIQPKRGRHVERVELNSVTLAFYGYDTVGKEVSSAWVKTSATDWQPMPAELTQLEGTTLTVQFKSERAEYKSQQVRSAEVTWRNGSDYKQWLDADLFTSLASLDTKYEKSRWQGIVESRLKQRTKEWKYDYPCLFVAPGNQGNQGNQGKLPPEDQSCFPANDPLNYNNMCTRQLTDQDVAGKPSEELRRAINCIHAHHGYRFSNPEVLACFKRLKWYKPTTDSQEEVKARITNEIECSNLDFLIAKRG